MLDQVLGHLRRLVESPTVSFESNREISDEIAAILEPLDFKVELLCYDDLNGMEKVSVIATRGSGPGGLLYCAHSDVVPVDSWSFEESGPFDLYETADRVYGRGSCDMKGSLACFLAAAEQYQGQELRAPLSILVAADEEVGFLGAKDIALRSRIFQDLIVQQPLTVIGEPTSLQVVHAHKGVAVFHVTSYGRAGHSSSASGLNANLKMIPFLQEMLAIHEEVMHDPAWQNTLFDPPTISWNIGVNDFTMASNITPERCMCTVCFRPMPGRTVEDLLDRASRKAEELGIEYELIQNSVPFYSDPNSEMIQQLLKLAGQPEASRVCYASDAAELGAMKNMVLCGPGSIEQAHTDDEWISKDQLSRGVEFYHKLIGHYCV